MIPTFSYGQFPPQGSPHIVRGQLANPLYYSLQAIFQRTGGNSGVPYTVGANLIASGGTQDTATSLTNDFNEVLNATPSATGVQLANLQIGQTQHVYNGSTQTISIYPTTGGVIDTLTQNAPFTIAPGQSASFTAFDSQSNGTATLRSSLSIPALPTGTGSLTQFLRGDLSWQVPPTFIGAGATAAVGYVPAPPTTAGTSLYLREDATWAATPGYGINVTNNSIANLVGDGVTDNSTNWATLVAGLTGTGALLYFPAGKYFFNANISTSFPAANAIWDLSIVGDGPDATIINFASGFGLSITFNTGAATSNQSFHLRDLAWTTSGTGTGTGITITNGTSQNGSYAELTEFTRVVWRGDDGNTATNYWSQCLSITDVSCVNLMGCGFFGPSGTIPAGTGVSFAGTGGSFVSAILNAYACIFSQLAIGYDYGDFVQGITFDGCNFQGCATGINVPGSLTVIGAQLCVTNCQFGMFYTGNKGIAIATATNALLVTNSLFLMNVASTSGIVCTQTSNTAITGNQFIALSGGASIVGASFATSASSTAVTITGNLFTGFNGASAHAWSAASTTKSVISEGNQYAACSATPFSDSSPGTSGEYNWLTANNTGDFGFVMQNAHGAAGDHCVAMRAGATGATVDASTVYIEFANGGGTVQTASITRNGATGISLNTVNNIANAGGTMNISATTMVVSGSTVTTSGGGGDSAISWTNSTTSGHFAALLQNPAGIAGADGLAIRAGNNVTSDTGTTMIAFGNGNGSVGVGSITRNATGIAVNSTSDIRLKEDIQPATIGLDLLKQLPVKEFSWVDDPSHTRMQGFIAQELYELYAPAVKIGGDDPHLDPWGVAADKLIPVSIKATQELSAIVERQQKQIDYLTAIAERFVTITTNDGNMSAGELSITHGGFSIEKGPNDE